MWMASPFPRARAQPLLMRPLQKWLGTCPLVQREQVKLLAALRQPRRAPPKWHCWVFVLAWGWHVGKLTVGHSRPLSSKSLTAQDPPRPP